MPEGRAWREPKPECQVSVCGGWTISAHVFFCTANLTRPCVWVCVAEFSIWTREAGAGGLSIAVEGPSKAEIAFEDRKDGSSGVSYMVQEPGERRGVNGRMKR